MQGRDRQQIFDLTSPNPCVCVRRTCAHNPNKAFSSCSVPQELTNEEIDALEQGTGNESEDEEVIHVRVGRCALLGLSPAALFRRLHAPPHDTLHGFSCYSGSTEGGAVACSAVQGERGWSHLGVCKFVCASPSVTLEPDLPISPSPTTDRTSSRRSAPADVACPPSGSSLRTTS